tara:strand:+ start:26202 stop:26402 length:201 start_codon:yes stop_codon:yes gene_type:complete
LIELLCNILLLKKQKRSLVIDLIEGINGFCGTVKFAMTENLHDLVVAALVVVSMAVAAAMSAEPDV